VKILRRDFIKALSALPFFGYFALFFKDSVKSELEKKEKQYLKELGLENIKVPKTRINVSGNNNKIRIGLLGHGWRGGDLLRSLGFANPAWIKKNTKNGEYADNVKLFLEQEDLNVELAGICDTFSIRAESGVETSLNEIRPSANKQPLKAAKIFATYREMVNDKDIDAVIIATPDHWHAEMAIEAAKMGKHIYCEKPMTRTIEEAVELRNTIKSSGVVFQLGHQNRQNMSYKVAKEIINKNVLGQFH